MFYWLSIKVNTVAFIMLKKRILINISINLGNIPLVYLILNEEMNIPSFAIIYKEMYPQMS